MPSNDHETIEPSLAECVSAAFEEKTGLELPSSTGRERSESWGNWRNEIYKYAGCAPAEALKRTHTETFETELKEEITSKKRTRN